MRAEPRYAFSGVDVGLPSKVRGSEAEEEWQEVDWVTWSTGELTVDGDSFLLAFKPSGGGAGGVKAKSLGGLVRASAVGGQDEEGRTFVVTTSDALHRLYRLTFQSTRSAADFGRVAALAESAHAASSACGDAEGPGGGGAAAAAAAAELEAQVRQALAGCWPLVFGGMELFGPDPEALPGGGGEVLLGRGAAVLLDPPEEDGGRVGTYELLFYGEDEGAREPLKRLQIGPRMALERQRPEAQEDEGGPAAAFRLATGLPGQALTIAFDGAATAAAFSRDFRVRQRMMDLSLKTVKKGRAAEDLRSELQGLKSRSLLARLRRLVGLCFLLLLLAAAARLALLYRQDRGAGPPAKYLKTLAADALLLARASRAAMAQAGGKACELAFGAVPAADVRRCAALAEDASQAWQVQRCLEALTRGPAGA